MTPTVVDVRVAGPDGWATWRDLRLQALQDSPGAYGSTYARELAFAETDWIERLGDPTSVSVLAFAGDTAIGMGAGFSDLPGWLHVVAMWVDPGWRGLRVGHRVLDGVRDWADGRGLRLHLDVAHGNEPARSSYLAYGFTPTGETRPIREGATELVERMVLRA